MLMLRIIINILVKYLILGLMIFIIYWGCVLVEFLFVELIIMVVVLMLFWFVVICYKFCCCIFKVVVFWCKVIVGFRYC